MLKSKTHKCEANLSYVGNYSEPLFHYIAKVGKVRDGLAVKCAYCPNKDLQLGVYHVSDNSQSPRAPAPGRAYDSHLWVTCTHMHIYTYT